MQTLKVDLDDTKHKKKQTIENSNITAKYQHRNYLIEMKQVKFIQENFELK